MGKVTGFLEFDRVENKSISPKTRVKNYNEFVLPFSEKTLNEQASRCMNCGIPYCHNSCPINNIIPDWNGVYEGDWKTLRKFFTQQTIFLNSHHEFVLRHVKLHAL